MYDEQGSCSDLASIYSNLLDGELSQLYFVLSLTNCSSNLPSGELGHFILCMNSVTLTTFHVQKIVPITT
jgi:hypothetical protein